MEGADISLTCDLLTETLYPQLLSQRSLKGGFCDKWFCFNKTEKIVKTENKEIQLCLIYLFWKVKY